MQKTLLNLMLIALVAAPFSAFGNVASVRAASTNTAIRGESQQTVYWYANDGKRYVFPNAATYFTWYTSFDNVQNISDTELSAIGIGGNVTNRPGAKLVKITTDPKVYAVARGGILRHVTSESLAIQLYGPTWASQVNDIPDSYFSNYTVGSPIYSTSDYNVSNEYNGVFNPGDSLRTQGQNNVSNQTGSLTLTADRTSITSGQSVNLTGTYFGTLPSDGYLEIKDVRNSATIKTCTNTSTCNVTVNPMVDSSQNSVQYYIVAKNSNGTHIATQYGPVIYTNGSSQYNGTLTMTPDRYTITNGQSVNLTATYNQVVSNGGRIEIKDMRTGSVLRNCYDTSVCSVITYPVQDSGSSNASFKATVYNSSSQVLNEFTTIVTVNGTSTDTLTLTADRTSINSGDAVTLTSHYAYSMYVTTIKIKEVNGSVVKDLCGSDCTTQVHPTQTKTYVAEAWTNGGTTQPAWLASGSNEVTVYVTVPTSNNAYQNDGVNYITSLTLQVDRTSINSGDMVKFTANAFNVGNWNYTGNRIEIRDVRTSSVVRTCNDQSWCVVDLAVTGNNGTAQYEARIFDRNGNLVKSQFGPVINVNSTTSNNGSTNTYYSTNPDTGNINGLTLQSDRTSINSGDMVKLTANAFNAGNWNYTGNRIEIRDVRTSSVVHTCNDRSWCVVDLAVTGNNGTAQYEARIYDRNGNLVKSQFGPVIYVNGTSSNLSSNNNLPASQVVLIPSNYINMLPNGGHVVIKRAGNIVVTCYRNSACSIPVDPNQNYSTNNGQFMLTVYNASSEIQNEFSVKVYFTNTQMGTIQYEADIYDNNGHFIITQTGTVTSVNGTSTGTGSVGTVGQIPNTDIYIAPATNVRAGGTVYLTASFTNLPYASTNSVIRLYTEGSSTAVGTCSGSVSCSVPYTISTGGVNTRVYGVASNGSTGTTVETARIPLVTN